jgi:integrase
MASIDKTATGYKVRWAFYEGGARRQKAARFHSLAEAKKHLTKVMRLENRGVGTATQALGEYLTEWLQEKAPSIEANTYAGYQRWIGHIGRCRIGAMPIDKITTGGLDQAYRELLKRGLSPQSVRHAHAVVQNALSDAVRHQRIEVNPALSAKAPKGRSPKMEAPSVEQVAAFIADLETHNCELVELALVIIATGLRRSEALGLRWSDIDWEGRRLAVKQAVIEHAGQWSIRLGTKSIAGQRTIGLATTTIEALRRQQARVAESRRAVGRFWRDDYDLVFPAVDGTARAPASVTRAFARASRRAGWPEHATPVHGLRHAAASHALAEGGTADLAAVSKRLGHSSPAVTARVYLSSSAEQDRAVADAMAGIVSKRRGG